MVKDSGRTVSDYSKEAGPLSRILADRFRFQVAIPTRCWIWKLLPSVPNDGMTTISTL